MASVMLASGRSRMMAFYSAVGLAVATLAGVLVIELAPAWLPYGLPISADVALYVAATDLVPEVNREHGPGVFRRRSCLPDASRMAACAIGCGLNVRRS